MTSSERPDTSWRVVDSRYGRLWTTTACLAAAAWIAIAVIQSPLVPLSLLVLSLSPCGGILAVRARPRSRFTRRFLYGTLCAAAAVLVTVGIGHQFVAGFVTVAALTAASPALAHRIAWRHVRG